MNPDTRQPGQARARCVKADWKRACYALTTLAKLVRLVLLAVVVDAMLPWVGGLTVQHAHLAASAVETDTETALTAEGCASCSAETELAASRAEAGLGLEVSPHGLVALPTPPLDGHLPPLFRPPIAA